MEIGAQLKEGKLYYTKDGRGKVIPFNQGWDRASGERVVLSAVETQSTDVWYCGISRHIKDIAENETDALKIKY